MTVGNSGSPSMSDVEAVVRENVSGHVDGEQHEHGKQQLLATLRDRRQGNARRRPRWLLAAGVLAALGVAGVAAVKLHGSAPLSYQVTGGLVSDSGYVRSTGTSGARLTFSDGTRVDLQDGARARVDQASTKGARITLENGHAALSVARGRSGSWFVDAGPFVIQVTGTQFDVDWSSYDDTLSVDLHEGSLKVSGPPAPAGVLLHAGQRLTAHEGRLSIEALEVAVQAAETPPALDPFPLPEPTPDELGPVLDELAAPAASR